MRPTSTTMRSLALALLHGCGSAPSAPAVPTSLPEARGDPETSRAELPTAPPDTSAPSSASEAETPTSGRVVLVDGVRDAVLLDELDGWSLVGGADTVALVGPDGHVHASHFVTDPDTGFTAVFLDAGEVIVGSAACDGCLGPFSQGIQRWDLDTDTTRFVTDIFGSTPQLARLEAGVVAVSSQRAGALTITAEREDSSEDGLNELVCSAPGDCFARSVNGQVSRVALQSGRLVLTPADRSLPRTPAPRPASHLALSPSLGAIDLSAGLAPTAGAVAIDGDPRIVLDRAGITVGPRGRGSWWISDRAFEVMSQLEPIALPTEHRLSRLATVPATSPMEEPYPPEMAAYLEWAYDDEDSRAAAPPRTPPVCSTTRPIRCVRSHVVDSQIEGWDVFDPARASRVLWHLEGPDHPPGRGYVLVSPGGLFVRSRGEDTTSLLPIAAGPLAEPIVGLERWVELEPGWVFVDPEDPRAVRSLSFEGQQAERHTPSPVRSLDIVDGGHVLVWLEGDPITAELLTVPQLAVERTLDLGPAATVLHCEHDDLGDAEGDVFRPGGCPLRGLDHDSGDALRVSRDGAFWLDRRRRAEAIVHRTSDGAWLRAQRTREGVLVSAASGVFEGSGPVVDHVVVREPGPVREATITTGAEARARFERPGLTAAFFRGEPLPTAP